MKYRKKPLVVDRAYDPASHDCHPLSFGQLREANVRRNATAFRGEDWTPTDWGNAIAGEVGEACNLLKKLRRGESVERSAIAHELADAVTYIDLLANMLGIDLGQAVAHKWNHVSRRIQYDGVLTPEPDSPCNHELLSLVPSVFTENATFLVTDPMPGKE